MVKSIFVCERGAPGLGQREDSVGQDRLDVAFDFQTSHMASNA